MFLAGINTKSLKSTQLTHITCPSCSKTNTTNISVIGAYKHLLQIPFLAGKKAARSTCNSCKTSLDYKNMSDSIKLAYHELKETSKTPIWFYSGIIGIKILVLIKIFSRYL
ncbi:MAG: hypothetical protein COB81_10080 [Flavobacteriaceae bacterium]|nr:MAG: hypothetical protein COB81_10080 [Flavobacteriaceae bacterium]